MTATRDHRASVQARIAITEDSWLWGDAVEYQLQSDGRFIIVGRVQTASEAIALVEAEVPDVLLLDLRLPDDSGLRVARRIQARGLATRVVLMTAEPSQWVILEARSAGVEAMVAKSDLNDGRTLCAVIVDVLEGRTVHLDLLGQTAEIHPAPAITERLTDSDLEMIGCFLHGMPTAEIARHLSIGQQTVRNRTTQIGRKLGVSGRGQIVAEALSRGLIRLPRPNNT